MNIEGKVALVTGGGTGVGRATAQALADGGCHVAVCYSRSADAAEATVADLVGRGVDAIAVRADVRSDADCRRLVDETVARFGRLDVLINNAGTTRFVAHGDLDGVDDEAWDAILGVNLKGAFQVARAALPALTDGEGGEIVSTSSVAGVAGVGSSIPYCASKAALNNLTVTLARVFAPSVRVNAVAPGFIEGRWLAEGLGEQYDAAKAITEARSLLGKVCQPEDVAAAILSLVTGSDLVTGQVLVCDGGLLIGQG